MICILVSFFKTHSDCNLLLDCSWAVKNSVIVLVFGDNMEQALYFLWLRHILPWQLPLVHEPSLVISAGQSVQEERRIYFSANDCAKRFECSLFCMIGIFLERLLSMLECGPAHTRYKWSTLRRFLLLNSTLQFLVNILTSFPHFKTHCGNTMIFYIMPG